MGKTGIKPSFAWVPSWIKRLIFGAGVLYWYPNRNPSDEINRTTGCLSLVSGLENWVFEWRRGCDLEEEEEKKRNAKANAAAAVVRKRREMRRIVGFEGGL